MANRLDQLKALEERLPVANQNLANQYKAGQDIQMQQAVGAAPAGGISKGTVAKAGAAQVAAKGQQQLEGQAKNVEQSGQVQKMQLSEQASQAQQRLAGKALSLEDKQRKLDKQLSQLTSDKKAELFDRQMKFNYTQAGNKYFNERQMSDWMRLKAKNQQEFANYQSKMNMLYERKIKMIDQAYKRLATTLESQSALERLQAKGVNRVDIERAKNALQENLRVMTSEQANRQAQWSAGGGIVGAVVGGVVGGILGNAPGAAAGVVGGGAIGAGAGSMAAAS